MMNLLDPNPNKRDVTVVTEKKETESVNPDQGLIEAAKELIKAIEAKKPERIVKCLKFLVRECAEEMGEDS